MKRLIKFLVYFGVGALFLGFVIDVVEKRNEIDIVDEIKNGCEKKKNKWVGKHNYYGVYEKYFKRSFDFAVALMTLIFLFPIHLILAVLIRVKLGKPVLFIQDRPGRNGRIFKLYKFRTMTDERDIDGELLSDEIRLKEFGKKLRATSLDELPELFNILKGDMSLVGPRPLLVEYLPLYNMKQARRHEVRPGITGLAQVHGRNSITWEEKFAWDVKYVDRVSFIGDMKIIFQTLAAVLSHEGINSGTSATMEAFRGNGVE